VSDRTNPRRAMPYHRVSGEVAKVDPRCRRPRPRPSVDQDQNATARRLASDAMMKGHRQQ